MLLRPAEEGGAVTSQHELVAARGQRRHAAKLRERRRGRLCGRARRGGRCGSSRTRETAGCCFAQPEKAEPSCASVSS
ncbi:hypothetical protein PSMK_27590 [Phycisphaera mikurensis NBRC 102666]|uniref:Uncharacterized protein n=1 Tax=Phycisphaera mikurensis (strain NBRC 102666 / KCTC 22515 / FYK2301M01) TaxID=1142394 RepID=I0II30_PHYMF|nr:hypothetical protein PSMK_27590 [Phycisphaera mikurensis NBRC 102666]